MKYRPSPKYLRMISYKDSGDFVQFFHKLPHFNLTLKTIDSTFRPENAKYRESLVLWAAVPVLLLVLTLVLFLIYFCYRCCQKESSRPKKNNELSCLRWTLAIITFLVCGLVGLAMFANEDSHKGLKDFYQSVHGAEEIMKHLDLDTMDFQRTTRNISNTADDLQDEISGFVRGSQAQKTRATTRKLIESVTRCADKMIQVNERFQKVKLNTFKYYAKQGSFYRWLVSLCLLSWTVALCLILLIGIGKASKCILLIFCATGTFTLVLSWMFIGLQLALTIGSADFCSNTTDYLVRKFPAVKSEVLFSYLNCQYWKNKQYSELRSTCRKGLHVAKIQLNSIKDKHPTINSQDIAVIEENLVLLDNFYSGFTAGLDCRPLNREYKIGRDGVCKTNIVASVIMLLSCTVVVLLLTVLIILSSHAWRHFSKPDEPVADCNKGNVMYEELMLYLPRKGYASVDEDDPFLPRETDSPIRGNSDDISSVPIQLSGGSTENSIDYNSTPKYSNYRGSNTLPNNSHHKTSVINSTPMDGTMPRSHYRVV